MKGLEWTVAELAGMYSNPLSVQELNMFRDAMADLDHQAQCAYMPYHVQGRIAHLGFRLLQEVAAARQAAAEVNKVYGTPEEAGNYTELDGKPIDPVPAKRMLLKVRCGHCGRFTLARMFPEDAVKETMNETPEA